MRFSHMSFALDANPGAVMLAVVVAFIVLCTLISLILKELFRRR